MSDHGHKRRALATPDAIVISARARSQAPAFASAAVANQPRGRKDGGRDVHAHRRRAWSAANGASAAIALAPRTSIGYRRRSSSYPADLVAALDDLMAHGPGQDLDWVPWLP